ncbi:pyrroline-5-carboxylate reductase [Rubrobacter indicoceani]|uniref:pyrroline-5-carboxylate reductase n=1 Tax=Rubrobacter indicoceani TaxID=2051957 RepID=UPI000E5A29CC|nr:pyrroline-5-carboxylate reductase [Rubrobacter indicoceani]
MTQQRGTRKTIGVIGAGKIGGSLLTRLADSGDFDLVVSDIHLEQLEPYAERGVKTTTSNRELAASSDLIVAAVKPWDVAAIADQVSSDISPDKAFASVAAGIPISTIEKNLPAGASVLRVMPNVCASVGLGSAVVTANEAGQSHLPLVKEIFGHVGDVMELPERLFDAATALHGSGPAYVALFADSLIQAGVREGIPRDVARRLVVGTIEGTAELLKERSAHQVRDEVMTPGGTTAAAFVAMERARFQGAVYDGVAAATRQAKELGG